MPEYRVGDIVRFVRTLKIVNVKGGALWGEDVATGMDIVLPLPPFGSGRFEMVKRAPDMHNGPKPEAGTVLKGRDLARIWWKRGTIIHHLPAGTGAALVLREDGRWHSLSEPFQVFEFDDLNPDARFTLLHVA